MRLLLFFSLLLAWAPPLQAQPVVVSPQADDVSVTVYRDPDRNAGTPIRQHWMNGYALISETRRLTLPAGEVEIRFEGVADNIFPQSVVMSGLPGLPDEKNYDARLLTPGALVDGALGQQVLLRRVNPMSGEVREVDAILLSGPNGIIAQTAAGFEAYDCSGLGEALVYNNVPEGLSARPTLSMRVNLDAPISADVTLSYLAGQFDWDANYVARLNPDGETMSLFAWLTVGNRNNEGYDAAQLMAVAGQPNRERADAPGVQRQGIRLECWPVPVLEAPLVEQSESFDRFAPPAPPPPPPPPPPPATQTCPNGAVVLASENCSAADIVVTGARIAMKAGQEELGDLKLYRVPERVGVAALGQKQVAFLQKDEVKVARIHRLPVDALGTPDMEYNVPVMLRAENEEEEGLGEPLPAGSVAIFEEHGGEWLLVGNTGIENLPVGQDVELDVGTSPDVRLRQRAVSALADAKGRPKRKVKMELTVTNARPFPVEIEIPLVLAPAQSIMRASERLKERDGYDTWIRTVPPESEITLSYSVRQKKQR